MRFKVLEGSHIHDGPRDERGGRTDVVVNKGDVVESNVDLARRFNQHAKDGSLISAKFERVWDHRDDPSPGTPEELSKTITGLTGTINSQPRAPEKIGPPSVSELNAMSMKDLQSLAGEHSIDLRGVNGREAVVKVVAARLGSPAMASAGAK